MAEHLPIDQMAWVNAHVRSPGEGEWVLCYWGAGDHWPQLFAVAKRIGRAWEGPNVPAFDYRRPDFWRELPEPPK
jgi:hypothetical protein